MAYQTGTSTTLSDLLDKFRAFALTAGWVLDEWDTSSYPHHLHMHKNSTYIHLAEDAIAANDAYIGENQGESSPWASLSFISCTGYTPPASRTGVFDHPNPPVYTAVCQDISLNGRDYWFFAEDDRIYCVLKVVVNTDENIYRHFGVGSFEVLGGSSGGHFCVGMAWNDNSSYIDHPDSVYHARPYSGSHSSLRYGSIYIDGEGTGAVWHDTYAASSRNLETEKAWSSDMAIYNNSSGMPTHQYDAYRAFASVLDCTSLLVPAIIYINRYEGGAYPTSTYVGRFDGVYGCNIRYMESEQELVKGGDTYMVFPICRSDESRSGSINAPQSGDLGIAYRKVV